MQDDDSGLEGKKIMKIIFKKNIGKIYTNFERGFQWVVGNLFFSFQLLCSLKNFCQWHIFPLWWKQSVFYFKMEK